MDDSLSRKSFEVLVEINENLKLIRHTLLRMEKTQAEPKTDNVR